MILLRGLVRLLGFLLLIALAVIGAAVAIFCIQGGETGLSIPALAELVSLPELGETTDGFRDQLEASGAAAVLSALSGLGAIVLGVLLIAGALTPARERLLELDESHEGTIAARRRPFAQVATALAERTEGVTAAKVRAKPGRVRAGRLKVRADRARTTEKRAVQDGVDRALEPLTRSFGLNTRIGTRVGQRERRVQ